MAEPVTREDVDVGQYPDAWEYDVVDEDSEVRIQPKAGFSLGGDPVYIGTKWRLSLDGEFLLIEYNNAGTWEEQARFEA